VGDDQRSGGFGSGSDSLGLGLALDLDLDCWSLRSIPTLALPAHGLLPVYLPHRLPVHSCACDSFPCLLGPITSCSGSGRPWGASDSEPSEPMLISCDRSSPHSSKALYGAGAPSSSSPPPHLSAVPSIHRPTSHRAESRAARSRKQVAGRPWALRRGGGGVSSRAGQVRWRQLRYDVQVPGTAFGRL
jgi:hypothetical protein